MNKEDWVINMTDKERQDLASAMVEPIRCGGMEYIDGRAIIWYGGTAYWYDEWQAAYKANGEQFPDLSKLTVVSSTPDTPISPTQYAEAFKTVEMLDMKPNNIYVPEYMVDDFTAACKRWEKSDLPQCEGDFNKKEKE